MVLAFPRFSLYYSKIYIFRLKPKYIAPLRANGFRQGVVMRIGSFMPVHSVWGKHLDQLKKEFPEHEFLSGLTDSSTEAATLDIILAGRLEHATYLASPALSAVFQPFTGINHLPLAEFAQRGVRVFNVHANAFDVAERALAMTLAFYGRLIEFHNDLRQDLWHGFWVRAGAEDNWDSLYGRTCAILGTGAIGVELAKLLKAFSCTVYGWRRNITKGAPEGFDMVLSDLQETISKAEIIFIALPATPLTEGLLSHEILLSMKDKFLVNVGRGSIVDEAGLYEALEKKILKGAAIDTWYTYPPVGKVGAPSRFPINKLPQVILSPHVGGSTNQATLKAVDVTIANIRDYLRTGTCRNEADLSAMY